LIILSWCVSVQAVNFSVGVPINCGMRLQLVQILIPWHLFRDSRLLPRPLLRCHRDAKHGSPIHVSPSRHSFGASLEGSLLPFSMLSITWRILSGNLKSDSPQRPSRTPFLFPPSKVLSYKALLSGCTPATTLVSTRQSTGCPGPWLDSRSARRRRRTGSVFRWHS
jgi:hypothetical protein